MGLSSDHREPGTGNGASAEPALDDHECARRIDRRHGPSVVGEQPTLKPEERFKYTSAAPLNTSSGIMGWAYQIERVSGEHFDIEIPTFSLDRPNQSAI